jgi:menaquinol-cytochrome c reductase cytochrome b/c subunit
MAVETRAPSEPSPRARPRPKREREEEVLVWPDLVFVEFISAVLFTITFMVLSTMINAPLLNRANTDVTPNPSKAPWYFLNLQELLLHMDKAWAGVLLPTIALVFFMIIPYIDRSREGQGVWFGTKYAARLTIITVIYATIVSVALVIFDAGDRSVTPHPLPEAEAQMLTKWIPACDASDEHPTTPCLVDAEGEAHQGLLSVKDVSKRLEFAVPFPNIWGIEDNYLDWPEDVDHIPVPFNDICTNIGSFHLWCDMHLNLPVIMSDQVIPLSMIAILAVGWIYAMFRIGWLRTRRDLFIVMFTAVMTSYLVLSMIGSFFRGQAQALVPPWEIKVDEG